MTMGLTGQLGLIQLGMLSLGQPESFAAVVAGVRDIDLVLGAPTGKWHLTMGPPKWRLGKPQE